jgi:hypothetical protein
VISEACQLLRSELEAFLRRKARLGPALELVRLTPFATADGASAIPPGLVGMCLFNIDEERVMKSPGLVPTRRGDRIEYVQPEVRLNLYLLFAANPAASPDPGAAYAEALRRIGWTVAFFQAKRVFDPKNTPGMAPGLAELAVDLYAMTLEQQNYLWSILGAKYLPSVAYQVRPVLIQEGEVQLDQAPVTEIAVHANGYTAP